MFVIHLGGKPNVRTWDKDGWSETDSFLGAATIVPATMSTRWLVDGELDVITLSIDRGGEEATSTLDQQAKMRFAFSDPPGAALSRQILAELYQPSGYSTCRPRHAAQFRHAADADGLTRPEYFAPQIDESIALVFVAAASEVDRKRGRTASLDCVMRVFCWGCWPADSEARRISRRIQPTSQPS